jgi:hypothetical protein
MMTVVGYPDPDEDKLNKTPVFCTSCRRKLALKEGFDRFDPYTGENIGASYLACPTMIASHDHWKKEAYGAWVNYATTI